MTQSVRELPFPHPRRAVAVAVDRRVVARWATVTALLLPASAVYLVFVLLPIVQSAFFGFFRWNGLGPLQDFVGLDNYIRLLGDTVFLGALYHNLLIVRLSVLVQLPLALGLALLVGRRLPGRMVFRTIFFMPFVLSDVVVGVLWSEIFNPQVGALNALGAALVPGFKAQAFLGKPESVLPAIFAVMCWKYFGFHLILYVAGLQQIPAEIEDAAYIDGCGPFGFLWRVLLPLSLPALAIVSVLAMVSSWNQFPLPLIVLNRDALFTLPLGVMQFQGQHGNDIGLVMAFLVIAMVPAVGFYMVAERYLVAGLTAGALKE